MITLYNPPSFYYTGEHYNCLPPLSLAIFAGALREAGIDAQVIDLEMLRIIPDDIEVPSGETVCVTGQTLGARGMSDSIQALRDKGYTGRIIAGGVHATLYPDEVLAMGADLVVTGESDGNFTELVTGNQTGIVQGEPLPIDQIASPDWDVCIPDVRTYRGQYRILNPRAGVGMWQRGCPFKCVFCGNAVYNGQKTRYRPPEKIAAEMLDLHKRSIDRAYIYDDEMIGTKQPDGWMEEIADRIEPLGMMWLAQARCSKRHITLKVLKDMRRAGCHLIFWGVESLSQNVLDAIEKHTVIEDIEHSLRLAKEAGIKNSLFMIVGSYKETEKDLVITRDTLKRFYGMRLIDYMQVFIAKMYPGTRLERIAKREGWYKNPDDVRQMINQEPYPTPWLSGEQIRKWKSVISQACPVPSP